MTLSPGANPEWLESEKEMEVLPAAMGWPPGAVAFCQKHSKRKNIDTADRERKDDVSYVVLPTLCGQ